MSARNGINRFGLAFLQVFGLLRIDHFGDLSVSRRDHEFCAALVELVVFGLAAFNDGGAFVNTCLFDHSVGSLLRL